MYCGDHFAVYANMESSCSIPETNRMLYVHYILKNNVLSILVLCYLKLGFLIRLDLNVLLNLLSAVKGDTDGPQHTVAKQLHQFSRVDTRSQVCIENKALDDQLIAVEEQFSKNKEYNEFLSALIILGKENNEFKALNSNLNTK